MTYTTKGKEGRDLTSIIDPNRIYLVDTCMTGQNSFADHVCRAKSFDHLNHYTLQEEQRELEKFQSLFEYSNVHTIPEVSYELKRFYEVINRNLEFFSRKETPDDKESLNLGSNPRYNQIKYLLQNIHVQLYEIMQQSRSNELRFFDPAYTAVVELISASNIGEKSTDFSETDKRLIAAMIYLSVFHNEPPIILTRDSHLKFLLENTPAILAAKDFEPLNLRFCSKIPFTCDSLYLFKGPNSRFTLTPYSLRDLYPRKTPKIGFKQRTRIRKLMHAIA